MNTRSLDFRHPRFQEEVAETFEGAVNYAPCCFTGSQASRVLRLQRRRYSSILHRIVNKGGRNRLFCVFSTILSTRGVSDKSGYVYTNNRLCFLELRLHITCGIRTTCFSGWKKHQLSRKVFLCVSCVCMRKTDGIASLNTNCERGADFRFRENSLQCAQFSQVASFYYIWQFDIYTHEAYIQMNDDLVWRKYSSYNGREKKARSCESVIKTRRNLKITAGRPPKRRPIGGDKYSRITESLTRSNRVYDYLYLQKFDASTVLLTWSLRLVCKPQSSSSVSV